MGIDDEAKNTQSTTYTIEFSVKPDPPINLNKRKNVEQLNNNYINQIRRLTPDLSREVVLNVLTYGKQLRMPGKEDIDENIFTAQMAKYFKITDKYLILRMFEIIKVERRPKGGASLLNFAKLVCIFISEKMLPKIDYAFRVYDVRASGRLTQADLEAALRPLIRFTSSVAGAGNDILDSDGGGAAEVDATDDHEKKALTEIVNLLLNMIDTNNDRVIDLGEFHAIVKRHPLMLECLGPCLPGRRECDEFVGMMTDKSSFEIAALFRHERKTSLNDPTSDTSLFDRFYPFQLEFP